MKAIALISALAIGCVVASGCGDDTTNADTSTSTSAYVPVADRPPESRPEPPLPPELEGIDDRISIEGLDTKAVQASGVDGELHVEGGVVVTLWSDDHAENRYVKALATLKANRSPGEVLFQQLGSVVVRLDRDGAPTAQERDAFETTVRAVTG